MSEKLSLQFLIEALAKQAKITKKEADLFFREFLQLILERIYDNDQVKIKDFGVFKLTLISSRESVDVNTGEKIEIPSHYRFGFHPDKSLKELINLPFSKYESVILEEGMNPSDIIFNEATIDEKDSEINISENIVEKTISEQLNLVNEFRHSKISNLEKEKESETLLHNEGDLNRAESLDKKVDVDIKKKTTSFKYVYTNSSEEDDSVTLNYKRKNIEIRESPQKKSSNLNKQDSIKEKESKASSTREEPKILEIYSKKSEPKINNEKSKKKYSDLSDLIEEKDTEQDSMFEIGGDSVKLSDAIEDQSFKNNALGVETKDYDIKNKKEEILDDDPNRPLLPLDERNKILRDDVIEEHKDNTYEEDLDDEEPIITGKVQDKKAEFETIDEKENFRESSSDEDLDSKEPKTEIDANNLNSEANNLSNDRQSSWFNRIKGRLPLILIIIVLVVFGVYSFLKLFDVKYDYERYLGNRYLTTADTLPLMDSESDLLISANALQEEDTVDQMIQNIDSANLDATVNIPISNSQAHSNNMDTVLNYNSQQQGIILDGTNSSSLDSLNFENVVKKREKKISNKLNFSIINKGEFFVHKNIQSPIQERESKNENQLDNKTNIDTAILEKGMTLRALAIKYYGNSIYWVYIYEANKDVLPNPNVLSLGVKLNIPNLAQFGITDTKSESSLSQAKKLENKYL